MAHSSTIWSPVIATGTIEKYDAQNNVLRAAVREN